MEWFRMWLCFSLPWHKIIYRRRLSGQAEYLRCSCGREYAINYDVQTVLPWADVSNFYGDRP